jgi:hypothetical protein
MTRGRPLPLSNAQLRLIWTGADAVPLDRRLWYLAQIEDELLPQQTIADADVQTAIERVVARMS